MFICALNLCHSECLSLNSKINLFTSAVKVQLQESAVLDSCNNLFFKCTHSFLTILRLIKLDLLVDVH